MPRRRGPTLIARSRSVSSQAKAEFHDITGAGRSQVKREFFDLNRADQDAIVKALEEGIDKALRTSR